MAKEHQRTSLSSLNERVKFIFQTFGASAPCDPMIAGRAKEGEIHWSWCPTWSVMTALSLVFLGLITLGIVCLFYGPGGTTVGVLIILSVNVTLCAIGNWRWNRDKQYTYSLARGKREEARALWANIDETQRFRAKDVFFRTSYGGKELLVLRDGTIECHGTHRDDLFEDFASDDNIDIERVSIVVVEEQTDENIGTESDVGIGAKSDENVGEESEKNLGENLEKSNGGEDLGCEEGQEEVGADEVATNTEEDATNSEEQVTGLEV